MIFPLVQQVRISPKQYFSEKIPTKKEYPTRETHNRQHKLGTSCSLFKNAPQKRGTPH